MSVIVPVRDGWNRAHACIASLVAAEPDLPYELILADDGSTDDTRFAARWVSGLSVIRSERREGLDAVCNTAAGKARSGVVCVLLGAPQLQPGAIGHLLGSLRRAPEAGLVGARVVGTDGRLEEAGSILRADGTIEPHGRSRDPTLPEFNYVRSCDGFVGDCIAMPTDVWRRLGGFSGEYGSSAYACVDLAYRVRSLGLRVVYQPASIVVRIPGGTDDRTAAGGGSDAPGTIRRRFIETWRAEIEADAFPVGSDTFRARGRTRERKTVVVIDHHVPTPDRDAGSRTIFQYLRLASELGYDVKFLAGDFDYDPAYRGLLEQEGIEILAGESFERDWRTWFREHGRDIHAVLFCRPQVTERFIDAITASCPNARRAYYGHDLHWVREEREYALTGDPAAARRAEEWRRRECRVIEKMHCNLSISSEESRLVAELLPDRDHVVFPVFYWDDLAHLAVQDEGRSGFLFVGGFAHRPNVDGLKWFLDEVWPLIRSSLPSATLHVVGSNAPPEILGRTDPGVRLHGFVDDRRLAELYDSSRVAVVPLRYGAGVKGKTVEAMRYGLPVVSTGIGIEGLPDLPSDLRGRDDAHAFASEAVLAHEDAVRWKRQVEDQFSYVRSRFSKVRAEQCLRLAIEGP